VDAEALPRGRGYDRLLTYPSPNGMKIGLIFLPPTGAYTTDFPAVSSKLEFLILNQKTRLGSPARQWRAGQTNLLQSSLTRAVVFSAMTTATAFGSLWMSSHPGMSSMGKLLALSLVCTMAAAVLFQPALMGPPRDKKPRRHRRRRHMASSGGRGRFLAFRARQYR
jgi:MMPL family